MYLEEEMGNAPSVIEVHDAVVSDGEPVEEEPTDEEKLELRNMTDACANAGLDPRVCAREIYDAYKEGGMEAARAKTMEKLSVDDDGVIEVADEDIPFGEDA
jgi:hypothetical protein